MGDPRNPARADEKWDLEKVQKIETEIRRLVAAIESAGRTIAISGGWAWHFMSPLHEELKLLHDHKDVDLIAPPMYFGEVISELLSRGFQRIRTQYDSNTFMRYEKHVAGSVRPLKVQVDLFAKEIEVVRFNDVWIVEPRTLLGFYDAKEHTTDDCIAVNAARKLIAAGIEPMGRRELVG